MILRSLAGFAVIALEEGAPEELLWWVRELPAPSRDLDIDVVWRAQPFAETVQSGQPVARRGAGGAWECSGEGHHLLAILQDVIAHRSATLLHAAGLDFSGVGVLLVGASGAGKSLATLAVLSDSRVRLLSDDLVVAASTGRIHPFPTPVAIRPYHLPLLPDEVVARYRLYARHSALLARLVGLPGVRPIGRAVRRRLARREDPAETWPWMVRSDQLAVPTKLLFSTECRVLEITASLVVVLDREGLPSVTELDALSATKAALTVTYENEDMAGAVERYADAGHLDLARHRALAQDAVERVVRSAERVLRIRLPSFSNIIDAQRWLINAIEEHLPAA